MKLVKTVRASDILNTDPSQALDTALAASHRGRKMRSVHELAPDVVPFARRLCGYITPFIPDPMVHSTPLLHVCVRKGMVEIEHAIAAGKSREELLQAFVEGSISSVPLLLSWSIKCRLTRDYWDPREEGFRTWAEDRDEILVYATDVRLQPAEFANTRCVLERKLTRRVCVH